MQLKEKTHCIYFAKKYCKHIDFYIRCSSHMFSQIQTLLTNHSTACMMHANKLAQSNRQKSIHGEDVFWGISVYLKQHDFHTIFWKLLDVSEELLEEYFHSKYEVNGRNSTSKQAKSLPLNKRVSTYLDKHIDGHTAKLDLDILFLASFDDLSNQFADHLYTHNIHPETIYENYQKLTKNPIIIQM